MKNKNQQFENLDLNPEEFRELGYRVVDMITEYYASIQALPVFPPSTSTEVENAFKEVLPEKDRIQKRYWMSGKQKFYHLQPIWAHPDISDL